MESSNRENETARRNQRIAALSLLIGAIKASGMEVAEVKPAGTTSKCHVCGSRCEWDQAASIMHTCEHCGAVWDQDDNAARNILSLASGGAAKAVS